MKIDDKEIPAKSYLCPVIYTPKTTELDELAVSLQKHIQHLITHIMSDYTYHGGVYSNEQYIVRLSIRNSQFDITIKNITKNEPINCVIICVKPKENLVEILNCKTRELMNVNPDDLVWG